MCFIANIALLAISAAFGQAHHGRAWYVDNKGSDAATGTKGKPFKTMARANSINLNAGDTLYFRSGQIFKGTLELKTGVNGTKNQPVVITSFGEGRAIIDSKDSSAIRLYKSNFVKLEQLSLKGSGRKTGNVKDGLAVINCKNIEVSVLDISGFQKSGLLIYSSQNVVAKNVFVHDNGSAGITVEAPYQTRESHNIKILNCRAENNPGDPTNLTNHSGNGIVVGDCRKVLIDHCTATNNGWDMPRIGNGPVGIWAYEADSVVIQHCLSYKNKTSKGGADGGGFDLDGGVTNSIVQYNMSYGNQGSGYCIFQYWGASPWHDNIFRYNISENDGTVSDSQAGLYVWNSSDDEKQFHDCEVYGNIIYNSKVAALCFSEKSESKGIRFKYNVFVGKDSLIKGKDKIGDAKYQGNNWWSIEKGFHMNDINGFEEWRQKCVGAWGNADAVIPEMNVNPAFKNAGRTIITSASQLKNFDDYKLSGNSAFVESIVYKLGIGNIKL
ncbi:right-handed parallel beta-helix repeat-containing protein [Mucilaginibacter ginsenosidivorans]|uniref:right-handed parallel beta-helix repeat-containing protein n=1 Tax=Mucilaginibacter ginsenosidivorans TaxID=398053 RepID=UPI001652315D|nr:right-handed parallel beta-helix repeat-containing protein [Mucilaginibacter ginsenosidivorans]